MSRTDRRLLIIAIDGPAASGKSTTAKRVADVLNYLYIDSGAMYRALTLEVIKRQVSEKDETEVVNIARDALIQLLPDKEGPRTLLNHKDVSDEIRLPEVTRIISVISAYKEVREIMTNKQRALAKNGGVVMDGRDIGTVVLPDADIKIYMDAGLDNRTDRRLKELKKKNISVQRDRIKEEIIQRDFIDSTRDVAPLKPADDAIIIDTSNLTIDEQIQKVIDIVREKEKSS
jgi:cytidylate kinase